MYILAEHRVSVTAMGYVSVRLTEHDLQDLQHQLRQAVLALATEDQDNPSVLANIPLLTSTIYETLRLYPPINQLLNRRAKEDVMLGGDIMIRAGTNLGYSGYTTNRDKEFWGADSADFRPGRWGSTPDEVHALFRRATSKSAFISFHGGSRTCLGIKFAMLSTRIFMSIILRSVKWNLDPTWRRKMTPVCSF
jgi:unspecific monooxygenase